MTNQPKPSDAYLTTFIVSLGAAFLALFLIFTLQWGLANERTTIRHVNDTWHQTIAVSFGPTIITPGGDTTQANYQLGGSTYAATVPWGCFTKSTPPAGTHVQVYASTAGNIYCGVPAVRYPPAFAILNVFGTTAAAILGGLLGWGLAILSWKAGWRIGAKFGPSAT